MLIDVGWFLLVDLCFRRIWWLRSKIPRSLPSPPDFIALRRTTCSTSSLHVRLNKKKDRLLGTSQWYGYLSLNRILLTWATCFPSGQTRSSWKQGMVFDRYLLTRKKILHFFILHGHDAKSLSPWQHPVQLQQLALLVSFRSESMWFFVFLWYLIVYQYFSILFIVVASLFSQAQVIVMHVLHCSAWQYLYTFRLGTWMTSFMQPILWVFLLWAAIRVADFQSWTWRETKQLYPCYVA